MRNHGLLSVGRTVPEAIAYMDRLVSACATQERMLAASHATPRPLSEQICKITAAQTSKRATSRWAISSFKRRSVANYVKIRRSRTDDSLGSAICRSPAAISTSWSPIFFILVWSHTRGGIMKISEGEIDSEQAAIVRHNFLYCANGMAPRRIAGRLNAEGIPSPRGWSVECIDD